MDLSPNKGIISKSLIHYFRKLARVSAVEELSELAQEDIMRECMIIGDIESELNIESSNTEPYLVRFNIPEYNRVINSALKCYENFLIKSKEKIKEQELTIPFDSVDKDLELVTEALEKISAKLD